tara:strand:+ start:859 stop:1260 length:402 start_codon:yes stop_codon:yes gene_type:complete
MVNYTYKNNKGVLDKYADVILDELRVVIEKIVGFKIYVKISYTPKSEHIAFNKIIEKEAESYCYTADDVDMFLDSWGGFTTTAGDFMKKIHLEVGGINGNDTISIRKLTGYSSEFIDNLTSETDKVVIKYMNK